jgi:tetratricopeptide (TPR) repeat protein
MKSFILSVLILVSVTSWAEPPVKPMDFGMSDAPPETADESYLQIREWMDARRWTEAIEALSSYRKKYPYSMEATMDLATAYFSMGERKQAVILLMQMNDRRSSPELRIRAKRISRIFRTSKGLQIFQDGKKFLLNRKYKQAIELFERALSLEDQNWEVLLRLAQAHLLSGDAPTSLRLFEEIESWQLKEPESLLWRSRALHQRGQYRPAISGLESALRSLPRSELAVLWLAEAYVAIQDRRGALTVLLDAVSREPLHVGALIQSIRLRLSLANDLKAVQALQKDLQVAQSRLPQYHSKSFPAFESELGIEMRQDPDLDSEIQDLVRQVEDRVKTLTSTSPAR